MYPNIVDYFPGEEEKPTDAGERLGSLPYHMNGTTKKCEFHAKKDGDLQEARWEFAKLRNNSALAASRARTGW